MPDPHDRLDRMIAEGRIIRGTWTQGHDRACLLAALAPECGRYERAAACPAEIMPAWLAHLTPDMDDRTSEAYWPDMILAYARLARGWVALDAASWERVRVAHMLRCLTLARAAVTVDRWGVTAALDEVARLLREGGTDEEWRAAARAAAGAAPWAAPRGAAAALAAALAAKAAAWATARADDAGGRAASAAARAARAAASAAARSAAAAAQAAAWDRITSGLLADIEQEIDHA